jgi:hypothetical protein
MAYLEKITRSELIKTNFTRATPLGTDLWVADTRRGDMTAAHLDQAIGVAAPRRMT